MASSSFPAGCPLLVDKGTFDRAQKAVAENKRRFPRRREEWTRMALAISWTGKLYCGECGRRCKVMLRHRSNRALYYLLLPRPAEELQCTKKGSRKDWIGDLVTDVLRVSSAARRT